MPKDTFFNLDLEKRTKIINAAKHEFLANPLRKARVSNIVEEARIPRGSFYQYFEDLDDLYYFIINEVFSEIFNTGNKYSDLTNDVFEFAKISYEYDYNGFSKDLRHQFMTNVFQSISSNEDFMIEFNKMRIDYIEGILDKMDLSNIKYTDKKDQIKMYQMIQDLKRNVIQKTIIDKLSKEESFKEFEWYLDVLQNGLMKGDNNA